MTAAALASVGALDRTKYLGGSDVAGILGISPWRTPLDVYLDRSSRAPARSIRRSRRFSPAASGWSLT